MNESTHQPQEESTEIVELDLTFKPEVFDPNVEQLHAIAAEVAKIEADPEKMTKDTLELINTTKNKLVKARTRIQKIGKAQRDPATKFAKEVKAYEDSLLDILAPEEERMKTLEKAAKEHAMREERMKTLPEFKEKLMSINDGIETDDSVTDDFLLSLDPNQRDQFYNERLAAKNEADREAMRIEQERIAAEQKAAQDKIDAEREAIEREKRHAEEVKAAEERAKQEAKEEEARRVAAEEAKRQAEEKAAQEAKEEAERKAREEEEARKANEQYQKWLTDHQYEEATDRLIEEGDQIVLYRRIASYKK